MRRRMVGQIAVVAFGGLMAVAACGQDGVGPTPTHPITTAPEGKTPVCTWGYSKTSGQPATGTGNCAPAPTPALAPAPALGEPAATQNAPAPSTAQRFPFPGEESVPVVPGGDPRQTAEPSAPAPAAGPGDASGFRDAGSSGSSSSSSSSSSGENEPEDPAARAPGDTSPLGDPAPAPKRGRRKLPAVARQTPDERETEDIKVAQFYMNDNNWRAAYLRGQDAVKLTDDDWEAHYTLAVAARKLGKLDEAVKEFKRTLDLDPTVKEKKDAEKALVEMTGSASGNSLIP